MEKGLDTRLREIARLFYALKDPLRLRILAVLVRAGEMPVTEIVRAVRVSQPLVSWHLARLRTLGLVRVARDGRIARYSVDLEALERQYRLLPDLLGELRAEREETPAQGGKTV